MKWNTEWKEKWGRLFQQKPASRLIFAGAAGILLLSVAGLFPSAGSAPKKQAEEQAGFDKQAYVQQLEGQLKTLIGRMDGAGETLVMVTLEEGENYVYVTDQKADEGQQNYETEHVLYNTGGGTAPLLQTTHMPTIRGVAVLCEGGEDAKVVGKITEAVSALLDLGTNRISVAKIK